MSCTRSHAMTTRSAWRTSWPYGVVWPSVQKLRRRRSSALIPKERRAPPEHALDEHPLRSAEAAEGGLGGLVGARDPAVTLTCG